MTARILVVDDSLTVRMDLAEVFAAAGFDPVPCATGAAARDALQSTTFALIVLDLLLPDADGLQLLDEIKQAPASRAVPVMLLTTEADVRDRIRGLTIGADEYIGKPYDPAYVVARARELIRGAEPSADEGADAPRPILVIDDSLTFRERLRETLERAGYRVVTAESGEEGLHLAAALRPLAMIVDGMLPGIDGSTVVRRVRLDVGLQRTPCLLLTASNDPADELRAFESGADAFVRKGAAVDVVLTRLAAVLRQVEQTGDLDAPTSLLGPKRILVVDDSVTDLEAIASQIRNDGYDVVLVRSGEDALQLLEAQAVDCVLLDLVLPGLSGRETCRRIKSHPRWRDIPVIMLTAFDDQAVMIECINAGADDCLTKSADFQVVRARLSAQLRRRQFEIEHRRIREELLHKEMEAAAGRAARTLAEARAALLADLERKNAELESFSAAVAHDLRAPLRAIQGYSRILMADHVAQLDGEGLRVLGVVCDHTQRMDLLIADLLAFARFAHTDLAAGAVDLHALAGAVVADLRQAEPARQVTITIDPLPAAMADGGMVRQVLANLIGNAWKFTRAQTAPTIEVGYERIGRDGVYFVRDNGVGFDPQYAHKLFGVFERLHRAEEYEGTGVGLAIVQRIVQRHGGRIWAEGRVGHGAKFAFTLEGGASNADRAQAQPG